MKKRLLSVLLICSSCLASQQILASTDNNESENFNLTSSKETLQPETNNLTSFSVNDLSTDISKNENQEKEADSDKDPVTYEDVKRIITEVLPTFSGYMQTGYAWQDKNAGNSSSFQVKRMRLYIDKKISNYFDFRAQFEVFSGSTDSQYKKRVMTILDAYINAHINKGFNFRLGQYYLPLGYENYRLSPKVLETVDFSSINGRMVCRNAISTPNLLDYGRDIGIMMYGDLFHNKEKGFDYLSYVLSVTNGNLPTLNDDNKSKDLIARVEVRPIKNLSFLASYNWGEYRGLGETPAVTKNYLKMDRIIVGAWYFDPNGLNLRSEYGHIESKEANVKEDGFYAMAAYKVDKFLPVVRWDMYRDRKNEYAASNRDALLFGCTYYVEKNLKFQAAYTYSMYTKKVKDKTLGTRSNNGNGVQLMCLISF